MLRNIVALILLAIAVSASGCSLLDHEAPMEDVDKAAALFFQRLDKQDLDLIYDDSSKEFKKVKTREVVIENLKQLTVFGKVLDYQRINMPIQASGKRMVLPAYATRFEQIAGEVWLTFQDESGEWKLFGFSFKPHR